VKSDLSDDFKTNLETIAGTAGIITVPKVVTP